MVTSTVRSLVSVISVLATRLFLVNGNKTTFTKIRIAFPHSVSVHTNPTAAKAHNVLLVSSKTALN